MLSAMAIAQMLAVLTAFGIIIVLLIEKTSHNQKFIILYAAAMLIYNLGYLFELLSGTEELAILSVKIEYTGLIYGPMLYSIYMFKHCRVKLPKIPMTLLIAFDTFILILVYTSEYHNLYYSSSSFENGFLYMGRTPLYYIHSVESWIPFFAAIVILIMRFKQSKVMRDAKMQRLKYICLIAISLIPFAAFLLYFSGILGGYDPTPMSSLFTSIGVVIVSYKFKLFDILSSAQVTTINAMDDGFLVVDENFNYVFSNNSANLYFPELDMLEKGDSLRNEKIDFLGMFKGDSNTEFKIDDRSYEFHITKLVDEAMESERIIGYSALIFDITQMQNYIEELAELRVQADKANQAKSTFLASMSHEIRTPMNAIVGMTELILREKLNDSVEENALAIQNAAKSLLSIINDILDFSKIESQKLEIVNEPYEFSALMHDVINLINVRLNEKNLQFIIKIDPNMPTVLVGDQMRIRQILINILNNAVKFTHQGYIELAVNSTTIEGQFYMNVAITDTGIGMEKDSLKRLFSSFQRLDSRKNRQIEGTGLGLAITKQLLNLMGGEITVSSTYGVGSTFYFTIPQDVEDMTPSNFDNSRISGQQPEERERFAATFSAPDANILIVDDNPVNLKVATGLLRPYNVKTATAESGLECIKLMELYTYDLILMDYMMPEMNGIDTLRFIRNVDDDYHKNVPIIVLTADAVESAHDNFIKQGFTDFLAKPIEINMLENALKRYLSKEKLEEPSFSETELKQNDVDFILEGVDIIKGLSNCGNDLEQYMQILGIINCYSLKKLEKISEYQKKGDLQNFTLETHSMKSSAANIGAMLLSDMCRELEYAGKRNDTDYINENTDYMIEQFKKLLSQIESVLRRKHLLEEEEPEPEKKLDMPRDEQIRYFFDMLELIDESDFEAAADITKVLELFDIPDETARLLVEIRENLEEEECVLKARALIQKYIDKNRSIVPTDNGNNESEGL